VNQRFKAIFPAADTKNEVVFHNPYLVNRNFISQSFEITGVHANVPKPKQRVIF
jgi:hypothetical protein